MNWGFLALTACTLGCIIGRPGWLGTVAAGAAVLTCIAAGRKQLPRGFCLHDPVFLGLTAFGSVVAMQAILGRTTPSTLGPIANALAFWALGKGTALTWRKDLRSLWMGWGGIVAICYGIQCFLAAISIHPEFFPGFRPMARTALFLATATLILMAAAMSSHRLVPWIASLATAIMTIVTSRRATLVAMAAATWPMLRSRRHTAMVLGLIAILAAGVVLSGQAMRFTGSFQITSPSTYERLAVWHAATQLIQNYPLLGCGFKTFKTQAAPHVAAFRAAHPATHNPESLDDAHNLILHLAAETGILGLTAIMLALLAPGCILWKNRHAPLVPLALAYSTLFFLHLQLHMHLFSSNVAAWIFSILGHTMALAHTSAYDPTPPPSPLPGRFTSALPPRQ